MSGQSDFNNNWQMYVLYYCGFGQSDTVVHNLDCSDVCNASFDINDNIVLSDWLPGYSQPSNATLIGYDVNDVLAWIDTFYIFPSAMNMMQPYQITSANLALMRVDSTMIGFIVYNITTQKVQRYSGSAWVDLW